MIIKPPTHFIPIEKIKLYTVILLEKMLLGRQDSFAHFLKEVEEEEENIRFSNKASLFI